MMARAKMVLGSRHAPEPYGVSEGRGRALWTGQMRQSAGGAGWQMHRPGANAPGMRSERPKGRWANLEATPCLYA